VNALIKNNEPYKIHWERLSENPAAMHILNDPKYYEYIHWYKILCNKNAAELVKNNLHMVEKHWDVICGQPHLIEIVNDNIEKCKNKINWYTLSRNPAAMHILNDPKYYEYIDWYTILYNENAAELVKNNLHMVDKYWYDICLQPHLIGIIEENMDKINWAGLSKNYEAIHILEQNIDKINVDNVRYNKNGFQLLLQLNHEFNKVYDNHEIYHAYHKNIVLEYFDYCEKNNIQFTLIHQLAGYGYTEKHINFVINILDHSWIKKNTIG
jgi:hypothetical protein